jgi:hypothetical protein
VADFLETKMTRTQSRAAVAALLSLSLLAAAGCSRTQQYTATGAALGAGGGALIAAAADGSVAGGAVVGGLVGAGAGYCIATDCFD